MAETTEQPSALDAFYAQAELFFGEKNGAYKVLALARTYPSFAPFLGQHEKELAQVFLVGNDEEAERILVSTLRSIIADMKKMPPQVIRQLGDELVLQKNVVTSFCRANAARIAF